MALACFVPTETSLEGFIEELASKQEQVVTSKTTCNISLLKEFMRRKEKDNKFERIERRELDEILCAFILVAKKKKQIKENIHAI